MRAPLFAVALLLTAGASAIAQPTDRPIDRAALVKRHDVIVFAHCRGKEIPAAGAVLESVKKDHWLRRAIAPIDVVEPQTVGLNMLVLRLWWRGHSGREGCVWGR